MKKLKLLWALLWSDAYCVVLEKPGMNVTWRINFSVFAAQRAIDDLSNGMEVAYQQHANDIEVKQILEGNQ